MISLNLTNAGRSAFISTNALSIEHFLCGDLFNQSGQSMETQTPFQFDIAFQQVYIKGQEYDKNGVTVTEDYDHIKIVGYLSPADITFDEEGEYTVREIALIGSINQQEVVLAYGYDEEGIKLIEDDNTQYTIKLDIICEATPNIQNSNANGNVTYRDFDDHINKKISNEEVHGFKIVNGRIYINNAPLVIDVEGVSNAKMDNIVGINSEVEVLPTPSSMPVGFVVALKDTGAMYKNIEITENNAPAQAWQPMNNLNSQIQLLANQMWFPLWQTNTSYSIGDPVKTANCKPFEYLECVVAGTTGATTPSYSNIGQLVTDNEVKWLVCDLRDSNPVGTIKQDLVVRDGYVLLDGQALNTADYPRLVKFLEDNNLILNYNDSHKAGIDFYYTNPEKTVFLIPDFIDKFIENDSTALNRKNAGLPNITGSFKMSEPGATSWGRFTDTSGVFTADINGTTKSAGNSSVSGSTRLNFDASKSNSIYGKSSTVQPPAVTLIPIIKY